MFAQTIAKPRYYEASIQTDSAITLQHLGESAHKVKTTGSKPRFHPHTPWRMTGPPTQSACPPYIWCKRAAHT